MNPDKTIISRYMTDSLHPKRLAWFFLIAFGWSWLFNALIIIGVIQMPAGIGTQQTDLFSPSALNLLLLLLTPFGPSVAAFVVTVFTDGKAGVRALWGRFWNRRMNLQWLVVLLLFYPILRLIIRWSAQLFFDTAQPSLWWLSTPWILLAPFLISILHGGLSEEFGWRGYALPRLQKRFNALTAALILGVIEGCWHIPLTFIPQDARYGEPILLLVLPYLMVGVFRAWIFNNTGGSILAAVLFHAAGNAAADVVPLNVPSYWLYLGILVIVAALIVMFFGARDLMRKPANQLILKLKKPYWFPRGAAVEEQEA